jgi:hypothetical protein
MALSSGDFRRNDVLRGDFSVLSQLHQMVERRAKPLTLDPAPRRAHDVTDP